MGIDWSSPWIVFFGDQWEHKQRRRQQIAGYLAKNTKCSGLLYIETPLTLTSFLKWKLGKADPDARTRWERVQQKGTLMQVDGMNCWVLTPITLFRHTGMPVVDAINCSLVYRSVLRAWEKLTGKWFFWRQKTVVSHPWWPVSFYYRMGLNVDLYDCTDDFSKVYTLPARLKKTVIINDLGLTQEAAVVTCVARQLVDEKRAIRPDSEKCVHIPNGVSYELFEREPSSSKQERSGKWKHGEKLVLGYVGGMNARVDLELLRHIAENRPDWRIAVAGRTDYIDNHMLPNLVLTGELRLEDVPNFLSTVDVCVVPHKVDELTGSMSPQKIYDYLASGKPIVATPVAGTEDFPGLVTVAPDYDGFIQAVESAVTSDTEQLSADRRAAARANSWSVRGEQIAQLLGEREQVLKEAA